MVLTSGAKSEILDTVKTIFTKGGVGISSTAEASSDTGLFGGGTTIDSCDADPSTWTEEGDGGAPTLNEETGEFYEGTGCFNLPSTFSSGSSGWYRTISSANYTGDKLVMWFYITDAGELATSTDAVKITLGTGGFTNYNEYYFSYTNFSNGWNSLLLDADTIDASGGTGADLTDVDRLKLTVRLTATQSTNDMRMDYWRYYEPNTLGVTDAQNTLVVATGTNYFKTTHSISVLEANGLDIVESGDTDGTTLLSRQTFATVSKGNSTALQIDKYYYID